MFIRYYSPCESIIFLPHNCVWQLEASFDDGACIYLIISGQDPIVIANSESFESNYKKVDIYKIHSIYEKIISAVFDKLSTNPNLQTIDLPQIEFDCVPDEYKN